MTDQVAPLEAMLDDSAPASTPAAAEPAAPAHEPAPTGDQSAAPPAASSVEPRDDGPLVPRRALEDERRKRQEYERQLAEVVQYVQSQQQQQFRQQQPTPQAPEVPDPYTDPEGYQRYIVQQAHETALSERLDASQMLAEEKYGAEKVQAALQAVQRAGPQIAQQIIRQRHPYKAMVEWFERMTVMEEIGPDPQAYREKIKAEILAELGHQPAPSAAAPVRSSAPVPKSLASATNAQPRNERGQFQGRTSLDDILG